MATARRWRDVLVDEDLDLYEAAAARTLTPELKRWLELGAASGVVLRQTRPALKHGFIFSGCFLAPLAP